MCGPWNERGCVSASPEVYLALVLIPFNSITYPIGGHFYDIHGAMQAQISCFRCVRDAAFLRDHDFTLPCKDLPLLTD